MDITINDRPEGVERHTPAYWTYKESIRAALPILLDDPIYANSTYVRHIDPARIDWMNDKELGNTIPSSLRWQGRTHRSRAKSFGLRFRRLAHVGKLSGIGSDLIFVTVKVETGGPATTAHLYDPGMDERIHWLLVDLLGPRYSFVWKLELGEAGGELHIHLVTFAEARAVLKVGVDGVGDITPVTDIDGLADYFAKPSDARITSKPYRRTPTPEGIVAAVLDYVHTKSLGSLDPTDWKKLKPLKGYGYGRLERNLFHAGRIPESLNTVFTEDAEPIANSYLMACGTFVHPSVQKCQAAAARPAGAPQSAAEGGVHLPTVGRVEVEMVGLGPSLQDLG